MNDIKRTNGPSRFALSLLSWRIPEPDREFIIGDLLEAFDEQRTNHGPRKARRWFWHETLHLFIARWPATSTLPADPVTEASMDSFMQSLRFAVRSLGRAPALTLLVILTLGLGIGATTSVYSVASRLSEEFFHTLRFMSTYLCIVKGYKAKGC